MKSVFFGVLAVVAFSTVANASTLECRILGINDSPEDVKAIKVVPTAKSQVIGKLDSKNDVSVSKVNGYTLVNIDGELSIGAGAKSGNIFLSTEGASVACSPAK